MEIIFSGNSCKAEYNPLKKRIVYVYEGYPNTHEHKSMYMEAMEFMKKNTTVAFIMDFRNMKGTFTMLNDWVIEFFRPAAATGLKKCAMVLREDVTLDFAVSDALKKVKIVQLQAFKDFKQAELWSEQ